MRPSLILRASHGHRPLIKFLGKRKNPASVDHTPQPHPASPTHKLPESFASYRDRVQQHGPLAGKQQSSSSSGSEGSSASSQSQSQSAIQTLKATAKGGPMTYGAIGGTPGRNLGSIRPKEGEYFDRSELPKRFQKRAWTDAEIDAVTSGGASLW